MHHRSRNEIQNRIVYLQGGKARVSFLASCGVNAMDNEILALSLLAVFAATSPALCQEVVPTVVEPALPVTIVPSIAPQIPIDAHRLDPSGSSELRLGVGGFFPTPPLDPIQISSPNFTYPSNAASTY